MGLADLHNFDKEGRPSVAHTDISLNQFVKIDGRFKLNDYNRVGHALTGVADPKLSALSHLTHSSLYFISSP